jgi:hypothetical protein
MPAAATDRAVVGRPSLRQPADASVSGTWFPVTSSCTTSSPRRLGHQD